tara:strand:- start:384 stop:638 length:255 start_codon:yes stop_codon:yes gene_type:complete
MRTNWEYVFDVIADSFDKHLGHQGRNWEAVVISDTALEFESLSGELADFYAIQDEVFEIERTEDWKLDVMINGNYISIVAVYLG